MLEGYEDALPGAAERIFGWVEDQSRHRRELEAKKLDADIRAEARGQHYGLAITLGVLLAGCVLIWNGKDIAGLSLIIVNLAGLVAVFIYGRKQQERERRAKLEELLGQAPRAEHQLDESDSEGT